MTEFGSLLAQINPGDVGFAGLLALAIYLILTGKLVPRSVVEDIRTDCATAIAASDQRANDWREVATISQQTNTELGGQLADLVEYAKAADHMIRSIQHGDHVDPKKVGT